MGIVRGADGTFYEVPDDQLAKFAIPEDAVADEAGEDAGPQLEEGPEASGGGPLVVVQVYGAGAGAFPAPRPSACAREDVSPHGPSGFVWRNSKWRNDWRNHPARYSCYVWRNYYRPRR